MAFDVITYALLNKLSGSVDKKLEAISQGMTFKGSVPTESDLPSGATGGDLYIIRDTATKAVWDGTEWLKFDNNIQIKPLDNSVLVEGSKVGVAISKDTGNALKLRSDGLYAKSEGGSGSSELEKDLKVSNPLGKYTMDEIIAAGTEFEDIFRGLLSKTYYPTLTDPSVSINYGAPALAAVGTDISAMNATVTLNRGSINPQYTAESSFRSGEATEYKVNLNGASVSYDETQSTNQFAIPSFTRANKGNVTLTATVSYAEGVQPKDSDGNNYKTPLPAGSKSATKTIKFIVPFYYGVSDTIDVSTLDGLTLDLSEMSNKTYRFTTNVQYMVMAYDSSYPDLKSIIDPNGFNVGDDYIKTTLDYKGQSYKVYVSPSATIDTNAQFTYNF